MARHAIEPADLVAASELETRYRQSFRDALITVATARLGAARPVSEGLRHGRRIAGVEVVDPFRG